MLPRLMISSSADKTQELGQVSANPVPGTTVQLAEEGNIFLWDIDMQGPDESAYAVCNSAPQHPP